MKTDLKILSLIKFSLFPEFNELTLTWWGWRVIGFFFRCFILALFRKEAALRTVSRHIYPKLCQTLRIHIISPEKQLWHHHLRILSALLAPCEGNHWWPVTGGFPSQRPVMWSFDVFFVVSQNKLLNKSSCRWCDMPWCSYQWLSVRLQ